MTQHGSSSGRQAGICTVTVALGFVAIGQGSLSSAGAPQSSSVEARAPLTIPFLANTRKPADLDFAAAECDVAENGERMTCRFRQVFLTTSAVDSASCVITTNGYERIFRRETSSRWVSQSAPSGACGVVETTTLEDGGGTRWTMTIQSATTVRSSQPECLAGSQEPDVYDWQNVKRKLPCTFIQPGAIER